jgi:hypothetical protein
MTSLLSGMHYRVIDIAVFNDTDGGRYAAVGFAAAEVVDRDRKRVEGVVLLLKHDHGRGRDQYQIKDLPESMGPTATCCPGRILNRLSPTDNEYALAWREQCREELELAASTACAKPN